MNMADDVFQGIKKRKSLCFRNRFELSLHLLWASPLWSHLHAGLSHSNIPHMGPCSSFPSAHRPSPFGSGPLCWGFPPGPSRTWWEHRRILLWMIKCGEMWELYSHKQEEHLSHNAWKTGGVIKKNSSLLIHSLTTKSVINVSDYVRTSAMFVRPKTRLTVTFYQSHLIIFPSTHQTTPEYTSL